MFLFLHKQHLYLHQEAVGEERVYSAYTFILLFITKGSQDWNSSRSESRSWCRGHGGMFLTGLLPLACLSLLSYRTKTISPEMVPPTRGLSPLITEKMPYSWISWRHFLNWSSFLCDNSSCVKLTHKTSQYNWPLVNLTHKHITKPLLSYSPPKSK